MKGSLKRILPAVVVDQSLENLTSIAEVVGSIPLWNSENLFRAFFIQCQEKITNVDIDKANKAALVGAQDNWLKKLHLLYKYCPSFSKIKYRMHWNSEGTIQIQSSYCVKVSCLLFWFDLLKSIFCHSKVLAFDLLSTSLSLKSSCLSLRI